MSDDKMPAVAPPDPPDPHAETTVTTGFGDIVPMAPRRGPVTKTHTMGDGREVAVADVVPWYKSFTFWSDLVRTAYAVVWGIFDIFDPVVPLLPDFIKERIQDPKQAAIVIAALSALSAWRRKTRNTILK